MPSQEKFVLNWNDFPENTKNAFGLLRGDNNLAYITLACEDGQQVEAHKVILASSSPFFMNLIKTNKHQHPLIYMRGLKMEDLVAILDFVYNGEAEIYEDNLSSFMTIAEELKLKGLAGENEKNTDLVQGNTKQLETPNANKAKKKLSEAATKLDQRKLKEEDRPTMETAIAVQNHFVPGDLNELNEKIKTMMKRGLTLLPNGKSAIACTMCGKEGLYTTIMNHIEAKHIDGDISYPCNFCEKKFR